MAYRVEQERNGEMAIVIDGFERGIAVSPHKGIANVQNVNLATETGEVMASFGRVQQSQEGTSSSGGTLTPNDSTHVTSDFTLTPGVWITTGTSTITNISSTTDYYVLSVSGTTVSLSLDYKGSAVGSIGATGTAPFTLKRGMGKPIAKAIEPYFDSSNVQQYRYYVLDNAGLVWVNDTGYAGFDWFLPDTSVTYFGSDAAPSGIAVLNGWLMVFSGNKIWVKSTVNLGATTATTTTYVQMTNAYLNSKAATSNPHYAYHSHQGSVYYTDGNYVGKIFPDSSLQADSGVNIQSYASYTASTTTGTLSTLISGSIPYTASSAGSTQRVPVVFFTDQAGTQPTNLTAGVVYFIEYTPSAGTFTVHPTTTDVYYLTFTGGLSSGATSGTLTSNWPFETGTYTVIFDNGNGPRNVDFTKGSASVTWTGSLDVGGASATGNYVTTAINIVLDSGAAGNQYFNTFYPVGTHAGAYGDTSLMTFTPQRLNLPYGEVSKSITEVGNTVIVGTTSNVVYPWNQVDVTPSSLIFLPEADVQTMITVNQVAYMFAGYKGNIYITDGSVASLVLKVPDYCAGIAGTPASYIEPVFTWGDAMYLRGRVYFSVLDQTSTKMGNCGGIWSFYPTQNLAAEQDTGLALRLENQNSYGDYNGVATVLIPSQNQTVIAPQFWSGWYSSITSPLYGIDVTTTTPTGTYSVETDLVPVGTVLQKRTFSQIEYKLATPLAAGETVRMYLRQNSTDSYTDLGAAVVESSTSLAGYVNPSIQGIQWAQFKLVVTPLFTSSSSFGRLSELRIR